jgi:two-component system, NtrC family, sensor kinase
MRRSLYTHIIAIVIFTVTVVLAISQAVDSHLTTRAVQQDARERADLVLRTVSLLWTTSAPDDLKGELAAIVYGDREVDAIDILRLDDDGSQVEFTTRPYSQREGVTLDRDQVQALERQTKVTRAIPEAQGTGWRVSVPLPSVGPVRAAAQVELRSQEVSRLERRILTIDAGVLLASIVMISGLLAIFLSRRVGRPIGDLVAGLRGLAAGNLSTRLTARTDDEFRFLTEQFNDMAARLEALTTDLGAQVRRATADLADRNVELQNSNDRLWEAQLELGRSDRMAALGQMAGTLAHGLGTPLNSVLGYVQLLRREPLAPGQGEKLAIVESQLQRVIEEMRGVLDRTRDLPLRRTPLAIEPVVDDAIALVSSRAAGRRIELRAEVAADLPPVPAEAVGLRQVLLDLLANAIDATPDGGTIAVTARLAPPDDGRGPRLELSVADSGHGMSEVERRQAFEPFYTTKAPGRGTGLGLVIVDHIVHAHGGTITVDSVPAVGTTVRVLLPLEV